MMAPRNSRYDRDNVADAALTLLDRLGLPDLSMRRLAAELDVQPSALYWHFANKQELLGAVADRIVARIPRATQTEGTLEARLLHCARAFRDALLAYRDGAELVISTAALQTGATAPQILLEEVLTEHISDSNERTHAAAAILQFVLGHTTLVQQRMHAESYGVNVEAAPDLLANSHVTFDTAIKMFAAGVAATETSVSSAARLAESHPGGIPE